tara:strand:+ start:6248 stop:6625 length:378 start_codon:yes stop_codon:yes gene_type:complete
MEANRPPPRLSITDVSTLIKIIDLASSKGAFRGADMVEVGRIYHILTEIVANASQQQQLPSLPQQQQAPPQPQPQPAVALSNPPDPPPADASTEPGTPPRTYPDTRAVTPTAPRKQNKKQVHFNR